ncbi:MAG: hypothetical protein WBA34_01900 [Candidatus Deferrimicrobiaceae bacterium]
MKKEKELPENKERVFRGEDVFPEEAEQDDQDGLSSPTWRGLLIAVIAAVVLSVGATLLLGGTFVFTRQGASAGCGAGAVSDCCAPREGR